MGHSTRRECSKVVHEEEGWHKGINIISVYDCVKEEELGLFGHVKMSDKWMLKLVGDVGVRRNQLEEKEQEAGGESKEGYISGEEIAQEVYEGCQ